MGANTKTIKRRIQSVKNTKKITKAMEMISAVKMRKATDAALGTRQYATLALDIMTHLSQLEEPNYALLEIRPVKNILLVLVSSNKGLCGSFNSNLFKKTKQLTKENIENLAKHRINGKNGKFDEIKPEKDITIDIIGIGKRSAGFAKKNGFNLLSVYEDINEKPEYESMIPISKDIIKAYKEKKYDKVVVAFTDYKSSIAQEPKIRQILPLSEVDLEKMIAGAGGDQSIAENKKADKIDFEIETYLFEPGLEIIIEKIIPKLVEIQLYQAVLESSASEHSARMVAMKNASEAAEEMISDLTLTFNKARQASITQEISEISGGAAALE